MREGDGGIGILQFRQGIFRDRKRLFWRSARFGEEAVGDHPPQNIGDIKQAPRNADVVDDIVFRNGGVRQRVYAVGKFIDIFFCPA